MSGLDSPSLPDSFWAKVAPEPMSGCWLWLAFEHKGYGRYKHKRAHRVAYQALVGPVPEGLVLDHKCRTTLCVNPDHLEPVTHRENVRRGRSGLLRPKQTHCPSGHELTGSNLCVDNRGWRTCRQCNKAAQDRWRSGGV